MSPHTVVVVDKIWWCALTISWCWDAWWWYCFFRFTSGQLFVFNSFLLLLISRNFLNRKTGVIIIPLLFDFSFKIQHTRLYAWQSLLNLHTHWKKIKNYIHVWFVYLCSTFQNIFIFYYSFKKRKSDYSKLMFHIPLKNRKIVL